MLLRLGNKELFGKFRTSLASEGGDQAPCRRGIGIFSPREPWHACPSQLLQAGSSVLATSGVGRLQKLGFVSHPPPQHHIERQARLWFSPATRSLHELSLLGECIWPQR